MKMNPIYCERIDEYERYTKNPGSVIHASKTGMETSMFGYKTGGMDWCFWRVSVSCFGGDNGQTLFSPLFRTTAHTSIFYEEII